jgi:hypothetical protein
LDRHNFPDNAGTLQTLVFRPSLRGGAYPDTIEYFKTLAEQNGIPYQNLINLYLRECAESEKNRCASRSRSILSDEVRVKERIPDSMSC